MAESVKIFIALFLLGVFGGIQSQNIPPFIKPCRADAKDLTRCFVSAMHHMRPFLVKGIPEINMPSTEPLEIDELSLSLTTGPNGYKVTLRDIDVFGASNFTASSLK
ncbi:hypothetical protein RUM44_004121 [Polyplax serrata]|uniref:Uncharacterized protein n=1 Tax=Polyplax serrata TaxID=468196 RepID=A0ABR1B1X9_POLSC